MTGPIRSRVLDAAALLATARGDTYPLVVVDVVLRTGGTLVVPASVISAAIATRPAAEPRILALIQQDRVQVDDLTAASSRRVGRLLASAKLSVEYLAAAHVVHASTERDRCPVFAGDPDPLLQLDPELTLEET